MKGLFVGGTKSWAAKLSAYGEMTLLGIPDKDTFLESIANAQYSVIGIYAHGNIRSIAFPFIKIINRIRKKRWQYVYTNEVKDAMASRPKYRLALMLNCWSDESEMTEALIGRLGVAISWKGLVWSRSGWGFINLLLDAAIKEPDKPIIELWEKIYNSKTWMTKNFSPRFQGNRSMTLRDVFEPYLTRGQVVDMIQDFFANKITLEEALTAAASYLDQ